MILAGGLAWTGRPAGAGLAWRAAFVALSLGGAGLLVWGLRTARPTWPQVLVGAVVLRVAVFPMAPALSDDGYRYLWDGVVTVQAGVSPYEFRPSAPALEAWHDRVEYRRMNSPQYYSVYPPASQAVFAVAAAAGGQDWRAGWYVLKLMLVVAELAGVVALARVCGSRAAALYAWHPLAVVEVAGQGHTEALVVGALGLVLVGGASRLPFASLGATLGGLVKLYPFTLLPSAWRREGVRGVVASVGLATVLTVPVWTPSAPGHVAESLTLFFGTFDAYAGPYRLVKAALYPVAGLEAGRAASLALLAVAVAWIGGSVARDDGSRSRLDSILGTTVCAAYLATSTLHPWYGLVLLFATPLLQSTWTLWVATFGTASYLSYELPGADLPVLVIGWGGGLVIALRERFRPRRHGLEEG